MGSSDLTGLVLQYVRVCPLQNPRKSTVKSRGVIAQAVPTPACLDTDQLHFLVANKFVEDPDRIRPAADAGNDRIRQFSFSFHDLGPCLATNYGVKVTNHRRIRVRA